MAFTVKLLLGYTCFLAGLYFGYDEQYARSCFWFAIAIYLRLSVANACIEAKLR